MLLPFITWEQCIGCSRISESEATAEATSDCRCRDYRCRDRLIRPHERFEPCCLGTGPWLRIVWTTDALSGENSSTRWEKRGGWCQAHTWTVQLKQDIKRRLFFKAGCAPPGLNLFFSNLNSAVRFKHLEEPSSSIPDIFLDPTNSS